MENFYEADKEAFLATLNVKNIIDSITLHDVKDFLESLGVNQIEVNEEKQYLICPTICHHPLHSAETMKLYWYQNYKVFHCYTECNESMSIFELYRRYMELNHYPISIEDAENYVKQFLKHIVVNAATSTFSSLAENIEKYKYQIHIPQLISYSPTVLDCFINYYHPTWLKDGLTKEAMDKFKIKFSILQNKIIIPHFDINGNLVGIRGRAIDEQEIKDFGKYRPIQVGNTLYTYPIQFNLYGIYEHQKGIGARRAAIIAEAEKSCILDEGYFGDYANCVACCGSSINKYHISLLVDYLGVNEITIALDKEYQNWRSNKASDYRKKIEDICKRYKNQVKFSYIWDYDNLLEEKDSPYDKGKDIFMTLYKNRVKFK